MPSRPVLRSLLLRPRRFRNFSRVTQHPTAEWLARQITILDLAAGGVDHELGALGGVAGGVCGGVASENSTAWQNGFAERLIGSIRRECVDHIVVLGETHFRRVLKSYARYYNKLRTHRSLDKDAPIPRPIQRTGSIMSPAFLGGLHHHYARV